MPQRKWHWALAIGLTGCLIALAALPPFVSEPLRMVLWMGFDPLCHQLPDRSFAVGGVEFAVCHRCFGTYVGLFLGALALPLLARWDPWLNRHAGPVLLSAVLVPGVDWAATVLDLWTNTVVSRALTGAVFGLTAGYFFARALTVGAGSTRQPVGASSQPVP